jgi:hypothetical protein
MADDDSAPPYVLPRYLRFARALALVSGAAVGIAAGASVLSCSMSPTHPCNGICGVVAMPDAQAADAAGGPADASPPAPDGGAGGGPMPAPPLPRSWLA